MIGNRLKEARKMRGHTLESLGEVIGHNARQIWRWESEETEMGADKLKHIAEALDVSADFLLGRTDDPHSDKKQLSTDEQLVVEAMRRGDGMEAIRVIATAGKRG